MCVRLTGEALQVMAEITNRSSRSVKPKFVLYEKKSFFAQGRRRVQTNDILKEKAEAVESGGKEAVTRAITIPTELPPSILNCSIIKLEYRLKVKHRVSISQYIVQRRNMCIIYQPMDKITPGDRETQSRATSSDSTK